MAKTAKALLQVAAKEIGYSRYKDPEQGTKYGRWYAKLTNSPYFGTTGVPFCAMFVSWCLAQLGISCTGCPTAACGQSGLLAAARRAGKLLPVKDARPGDVVLFNWKNHGYNSSTADHTGFCERNNGSSLSTIEGNVGGAVARRTRPYNCIVGVIRPNYDAESSSSSSSSSNSSSSSSTATDKLYVDGVFGSRTATNLQKTLRNKGYYTTTYLIDGNFGYYSKLALQHYLRDKGYYGTKYYLDGNFGYYSVLGLQKYLRKLGYYGTEYYLDGKWGKYTTMALQRALNDGKF